MDTLNKKDKQIAYKNSGKMFHAIVVRRLTFKKTCVHMQPHAKKNPLKFILYIYTTRTVMHFYALLHNLYFPQNAISFIILAFLFK
jgi:hypothetical protein